MLVIYCNICNLEVSTVYLSAPPTDDQLAFYKASSSCNTDGNNGSNIIVQILPEEENT